MGENKLYGQKTYEYVFDYFSKQILSGELKLNDKLPTERAIAEKLDVSRNSVREVMHMLEIAGMIECQQGSGNYVRCEPLDFMEKTVSMFMTLMGAGYKDIFYMRSSYEYTALGMAMYNATQEELDKMKEILERMDEPMSAKESAIYDQKFHHTLIEASHNQVLIVFYSMIINLIDSFIENFRSRIMKNKMRAELLRKSHWEIYRALENHDMAEGTKAMGKHFRIVLDQLNKIIPEN